MENSILNSVKKHCGVTAECTDFDDVIIEDTNSVFMYLHQLGVGPKTPFLISSASSVWSDFMENKNYINAAKTFVGLKVKLMFDPPTNSFLVNAINDQIKEAEWRLYIACDDKRIDEEVRNGI